MNFALKDSTRQVGFPGRWLSPQGLSPSGSRSSFAASHSIFSSVRSKTASRFTSARGLTQFLTTKCLLAGDFSGFRVFRAGCMCSSVLSVSFIDWNLVQFRSQNLVPETLVSGPRCCNKCKSRFLPPPTCSGWGRRWGSGPLASPSGKDFCTRGGGLLNADGVPLGRSRKEGGVRGRVRSGCPIHRPQHGQCPHQGSSGQGPCGHPWVIGASRGMRAKI